MPSQCSLKLRQCPASKKAIGVEQQDGVVAAAWECEIVGLAEADVLPKFDDLNFRKPLPYQFHSSVRRTVVHQDGLQCGTLLDAQCLEAAGENFAGVEAHYNGRDAW